MVIVMVVVLALAAPAAAESPAGDGTGWSWSSVVEGLSDWMDGLWRAFAGSETDGEEEDGDDDGVVMVFPDDTSWSTEPTNQTQSAPEYDPNGEP